MSRPDSDLRLYAGVPLDNTYKCHFGAYTTTALTNYSSIYFDELSWIRLERQRIRLSTNVGDNDYYPDWFYDYNYLKFNNQNKTYYCFITGYEYVNDNTVDIFFEIDVLATYWNDWSFQNCFIQREHVSRAADIAGVNTLPEPVSLGVYDCVSSGYLNSINTNTLALLMFFAPCVSGDSTSPVFTNMGTNKINGAYMGCVACAIYVGDTYSSTSWVVGYEPPSFVGSASDNIATVLKNFYNSNWRCIYAVYIPADLFNSSTTYVYDDGAVTRSTAIGTNLNNVRIQNAKCFTYPYCYLQVDNQLGDSNIYLWEQFSDQQTAEFWVSGCCLPSPCVIAVPHNYRGLNKDYENCVSIANFPQVPVQSEGISNWDAQHGTAMGLKTITSAITGAIAGAAVGGGVGAVAGGTVGLISGAASMVAGREEASQSSAKMTNAGGNPNMLINMLNHDFGFVYKYMALRQDVLRSVDNFFTRYGYRVDRVGLPHVNTRSRFNYIQNYETNIKVGGAGIPTNAVRKICEIFNAGITIWHTTQDYGNYLDNN